jgi:hypothetical protein
MEFQNLINALRSHHNQRPFHQYDIELASGTVLRVQHPDALAFYGHRAVVMTADGMSHTFDHEAVARLTATTEPPEKVGPSIKPV